MRLLSQICWLMGVTIPFLLLPLQLALKSGMHMSAQDSLSTEFYLLDYVLHSLIHFLGRESKETALIFKPITSSESADSQANENDETPNEDPEDEEWSCGSCLKSLSLWICSVLILVG